MSGDTIHAFGTTIEPVLDTSYLNRTENKAPRRPEQEIEFVVCHETASPNPNNPYGTLNYNLPLAIQSSYNYLIARTGRIFHYVDEREWISYHAGVNSAWMGYEGYQINIYSLGVELDGANKGAPCTKAQIESFALLALYFQQAYGIPLEEKYYPHHSRVAPGYKSDPRGYTATQVLDLARSKAAVTDLTVIGVQPSATLAACQRSLVRNQAPISAGEAERWHRYSRELEVDPTFQLALWAQGGRPFGSHRLQQLTRMPVPIRCEGGNLIRTVADGGIEYLWAESPFLGLLELTWQLKNAFGSAGKLSISQIAPELLSLAYPDLAGDKTPEIIRDMRYIARN